MNSGDSLSIDKNSGTVNWSLRRGVATSITVGAVFVVVLIFWIVAATRGAPRPDLYPNGLLSVIPGEGSKTPYPSPVGVSLSPGWQPTLTIDGVVIPDTELTDGTRELGEFFYIPADEKTLPELRTGNVCARVVAVPTINIEADNIDFEWCFTTF
ncbi:MAG: hypothetical protein GWP30_03740 [Actinobacteria bacterium]|nr:hypothetical protein [Actinomycetota bacterium]